LRIGRLERLAAAMKLEPPDHDPLDPGQEASIEDRAEAFQAIYRDERPRLLRYFLYKLGNRADADDLANETMTRYLGAAPAGSIVTPRAYLTRIATNLLRDRAERGSTKLAQLSVPLDEGLNRAVGLDPHREIESRQELERWKAILLQLPPRTLEIFLLNRVEGISYRDIAADLGLPLWMIQKHMLKAIRHIAANQDHDHG
jgi:RNA polymerase sigma-70 factor (ECF subfamily)